MGKPNVNKVTSGYLQNNYAERFAPGDGKAGFFQPPLYHQGAEQHSHNSSYVDQKSFKYTRYVQANTPNYFTLVKAGKQLPVNQFGVTVEEWQCPTGKRYFRQAGSNSQPTMNTGSLLIIANTYNYHPQIYPNFEMGMSSIQWGGGIFETLSSAEMNSTHGRAVTKLKLKVGDQKANMAENLATANKTADMFVTNVTRVISAVRALKRGDLGAAGKALETTVTKRQNGRYSKRYAANRREAVANGWLELQYGWKPLVKDMYGIAELLHQKYSENALIHKAVGTGSVKKERRYNPVGPDGTCKFTSIYAKTVHSNRYVVYYRIRDTQLRTLQQLGIVNPAQLAWDLLPYSFVIDWFLPIGNWLQSMTSTLGVEFVTGYWNRLNVEYSSRTDRGRDLTSPLTKATCDVNYTAYKRRVDFQRSALSSWPANWIPSFKNPFSTEHVANAVALINNFKRK
jgi:hypothetical protein